MDKQCSICGIVKPVKDFAIRNNRRSGVQPYCKDCDRERQRARRGANHTELSNRTHYLYEWKSYDGTTCYVGITGVNIQTRSASHKAQAYVWTDYAIEPTEPTAIFDSRDAALTAEKELINSYCEQGIRLVNISHNYLNDGDAYYISVVEDLRKAKISSDIL